ncbi:uncharacterized protein G2W53_026784 [Senna tora]|uniref:Uncharacterized protein n=1 Tax=Senna tora TaxID=362788 RepID=A0A834WLN3_9FABA|nr:uncharacterized protein G2W53_026784 [Senna tora]
MKSGVGFTLFEKCLTGHSPNGHDIDGLLSLDPYMLVDEGKGAIGSSGLANDVVDVIPQDEEMGVVGADVVFVHQILVASQNKVGEASQQAVGGEAGQIVVASQNILGEASEQVVDDEMELVKQVFFHATKALTALIIDYPVP